MGLGFRDSQLRATVSGMKTPIQTLQNGPFALESLGAGVDVAKRSDVLITITKVCVCARAIFCFCVCLCGCVEGGVLPS